MRTVRGMTVADDIESLIRRKPGLSEIEIAEALFGASAYQQRVNSTCRRLIAEGRIARSGDGGIAEPFRYRVKELARAR